MSYKLIFSIPIVAGGAGLSYGAIKSDTPRPQVESPAQAKLQTERSADLIPINRASPRQSSVRITDKHGNYTFSLSASRKTLKVTEASAIPNKRGIEGGGLSDFLYLDAAATRKFEREFKDATHCPASFFNRHSGQKQLYATDPRIKKALKSWNNPTWKKTSKWKTTELLGRCITGTTNYTIGGEQMAPYVEKSSFSG